MRRTREVQRGAPPETGVNVQNCRVTLMQAIVTAYFLLAPSCAKTPCSKKSASFDVTKGSATSHIPLTD